MLIFLSSASNRVNSFRHTLITSTNYLSTVGREEIISISIQQNYCVPDENMCGFSLECSHNCHNAPEGIVCSCPEHLYMQTDGVTCLDSHPCDSWGTCSQKCIPNGKHNYKCLCNKRYQLQNDGFSCKSNGKLCFCNQNLYITYEHY